MYKCSGHSFKSIQKNRRLQNSKQVGQFTLTNFALPRTIAVGPTKQTNPIKALRNAKTANEVANTNKYPLATVAMFIKRRTFLLPNLVINKTNIRYYAPGHVCLAFSDYFVNNTEICFARSLWYLMNACRENENVNHIMCTFDPSTNGLHRFLNVCGDYAVEQEIFFNCTKRCGIVYAPE